MTNYTKCDINLSCLGAFLILLHSILGFSFWTYILIKHIHARGKHGIIPLEITLAKRDRNETN